MNIIQYEFFQNAILALILASILSGTIGSLIVAKKITNVSGSISHGAFGGLGIAYYLSINPLIGAFLFALSGAGIISFFRKNYTKSLESLLTTFWAGGMSIGLIFVFLTPGYAGDLFSYLFGNVLLSTRTDLFLLGVVTLLTLIITKVLYQSLLLVLFDEEYAKLKGKKTSTIYLVFLSLISITIVMLINTVGVTLVVAILSISPTIGIKYSKNLTSTIYFSIIFNLITSLSGLFLAYYFDLPAAPVIILLQIGIFGLSLFSKNRIANKL